MKTARTYGFVDAEGKLNLYNRKRLADELKRFAACDVSLEIKKRGKRSTAANNYYWACLVAPIQAEFQRRGIDMDDEQVHTFLKLHFNKKYIWDANGEVIGEYGGSTAEMNAEEMSDYMERITVWCAEKLNLVIEPPATQTQMEFL